MVQKSHPSGISSLSISIKSDSPSHLSSKFETPSPSLSIKLSHPSGYSYATYQFTGIDSNYQDSQSITGSRSSEDFRAEGWLSGSRIDIRSVFL